MGKVLSPQFSIQWALLQMNNQNTAYESACPQNVVIKVKRGHSTDEFKNYFFFFHLSKQSD